MRLHIDQLPKRLIRKLILGKKVENR
ncbi:protein of unknown function [Burkholderia multivorans]